MRPGEILCSCGEREPHVIALRTACDGVGVALWSDGAVTGHFGNALPCVPIMRPRTAAARCQALKAGRLLLGEVCIYRADELGDLYQACRWAAARDGLPGTVRARLTELRRGTLAPRWEVAETDRDGRTKARYWRVPRMIAGGTVVWDHVSSGRGGRYEIMREASGSRGQTVMPSGIRFARLADVSRFLLEERGTA